MKTESITLPNGSTHTLEELCALAQAKLDADHAADVHEFHNPGIYDDSPDPDQLQEEAWGEELQRSEVDVYDVAAAEAGVSVTELLEDTGEPRRRRRRPAAIDRVTAKHDERVKRVERFHRQQKELAELFQKLGAPHLRMRIIELFNYMLLLEKTRDSGLTENIDDDTREATVALYIEKINETCPGLDL